MTARFECPCCGCRTIAEEPPGTFEVCPVCDWEDDAVQAVDPTYAGGANRVSLDVARRNFAAFGAISEEARAHVRNPTADESP